MLYFVYILKCADGSLYTGITTDLKRRFVEHKDRKGGGYTSAHGAKKIVYTEKHPTRSSALKREAEIKSWERSKKLDLIKSKPAFHP
ncbi:MAG: putative endonuclease [Parcubacteria group bacterium LiPW_15]|nr:MAG: putative endonuclease [Parcubacteria group bacterium LiPW_15]